MAEKLYTIPVNDAFDEHSECPICSMIFKLEADAVAFMMGPSYMEDDVRMETDRIGFCDHHMRMLLEEKNRLGLSLILKTHLDRQVASVEKLAKTQLKPKSFLKKNDESEIAKYLRETDVACYICNRINLTFPHYLDTTVRLYEKDAEFKQKYLTCKGFCGRHLGLLLEKGRESLSGKTLAAFQEDTVRLYSENLKRLAGDLDWFQNKFDYRYRDEPWKDSKDAIERAAVKTNGILPKK